MTRLNNRGITLVETVVSIVLISIVLIFIISLFLTVRNEYVSNKAKSQYEITSSSIMKAISDDIYEYGLYSCEEVNCIPKNNTITLIYNSYRPTKLNDRITKVLSVFNRGDKYYISYVYKDKYKDCVDAGNNNCNSADVLTSEEKSKNITLELVDIDELPNISTEISEKYNYLKLVVPIEDDYGNDYDIRVYGKLLK